MLRAPRQRRFSTGANSSTSSSTSPERGADDDNDSIMINANDSVSSIAASVEHDRDAIEERRPLAPIETLPAELMIAIFSRLSSSPQDLRSCMLVCRDWARNSVALLWHRPQTNNWKSLQTVVRTITNKSTFDYPQLVRRLNLSTLNNQVSDGVLLAFQECKRIERLTLTNCTRLSDQSVKPMITGNRSLLALDVTGLEGVSSDTMLEVAKNCYRLQGLNITNCRLVTDEGLEAIARSCRHIKRLKFNGCNQITTKAVLEFASAAQYLLEIDLHCVHLLEDDAVTALIQNGKQLRELRLSHCSRITDGAFLNLPPNAQYESLRILDLTDCIELQDIGVHRIVTAAPRLRNLVLAKCRQLTDRAVVSITRLGKNLHYIHLGHCARITDAGVLQLIKLCNRIRYIDLACCSQLTDNSVHMLATLPKLKRIGLVKCDNITDRSIYALAKPRHAPNPPNVPGSYGYGQNPPPTVVPSSLERVHLSYCRNLTLNSIHALLNNCPRLTHLSLTGVQAFLREDLLRFCREAPPEFNEHQRNLFCVFSGHGVKDLRTYLNEDVHLPPPFDPSDDDDTGLPDHAAIMPPPTAPGHGTMFDDGDDDDETLPIPIIPHGAPPVPAPPGQAVNPLSNVFPVIPPGGFNHAAPATPSVGWATGVLPPLQGNAFASHATQTQQLPSAWSPFQQYQQTPVATQSTAPHHPTPAPPTSTAPTQHPSAQHPAPLPSGLSPPSLPSPQQTQPTGGPPVPPHSSGTSVLPTPPPPRRRGGYGYNLTIAPWADGQSSTPAGPSTSSGAPSMTLFGQGGSGAGPSTESVVDQRRHSVPRIPSLLRHVTNSGSAADGSHSDTNSGSHSGNGEQVTQLMGTVGLGDREEGGASGSATASGTNEQPSGDVEMRDG